MKQLSMGGKESAMRQTMYDYRYFAAFRFAGRFIRLS